MINNNLFQSEAYNGIFQNEASNTISRKRADILTPMNGELYFDKEYNEIYFYNYEDTIDIGEYLTINKSLLEVNGYNSESDYNKLINDINFYCEYDKED